jgi:acetyl esterase
MLDLQARARIDSVAAEGGPPLCTLMPSAAPTVLDSLQSGPVDKLPADIEERTLAGGQTGQISIRIERPKGITAALPVVMYTMAAARFSGTR